MMNPLCTPPPTWGKTGTTRGKTKIVNESILEIVFRRHVIHGEQQGEDSCEE